MNGKDVREAIDFFNARIKSIPSPGFRTYDGFRSYDRINRIKCYAMSKVALMSLIEADREKHQIFDRATLLDFVACGVVGPGSRYESASLPPSNFRLAGGEMINGELWLGYNTHLNVMASKATDLLMASTSGLVEHLGYVLQAEPSVVGQPLTFVKHMLELKRTINARADNSKVVDNGRTKTILETPNYAHYGIW